MSTAPDGGWARPPGDGTPPQATTQGGYAPPGGYAAPPHAGAAYPGVGYAPPAHPGAPYPGGGYPLPVGGYGQPAAGQPPAVSLGWRIRHSWWLLLPIFGFTCLSGVGFLYIGLRARRPSWWIPGIVYMVVGWTSFIVAGEAERHSALEDVGFGIFFALWLAGIVHACLINSSWLRWRAGYRPWYAQPAAPFPYPPGVLAPPPYPPAAGAVPGHVPAAQPPTTGAQVPPIGPSSDTLDVNATDADQLAALPGFDRARAEAVLAERQARRGFGSVDEFVAVANLAPHEYARLRHLLVCGPATPSSGLTTPPASPAVPSPHGRVLDV